MLNKKNTKVFRESCRIGTELVLYIGKYSQAAELRFPASITHVNQMRLEAFLLNGVKTVFVGFDYAEYRPVLPPAQGALVIRLQ